MIDSAFNCTKNRTKMSAVSQGVNVNPCKYQHARQDSNLQPSVPKTEVEDAQVPLGESLTTPQKHGAAPGAARRSVPTMPPDLAKVIAAWPTLPNPIRTGILALIDATVGNRP